MICDIKKIEEKPEVSRFRGSMRLVFSKRPLAADRRERRRLQRRPVAGETGNLFSLGSRNIVTP
jgi:hypothetical protein